MIELLVGGLILAIIAGSICGIVAIINQSDTRYRLDQFGRQLNELRYRFEHLQRQLSLLIPKTEQASAREEQISRVAKPEKPPDAEPAAAPPPTPLLAASEPVQPQQPVPPPFAPSPVRPPGAFDRRAEPVAGRWSNFEVTIGSKWLNWVGVALVTIGVAFFLKYAYDNQWIGPVGRIAIGAMAGVAALMIGEKSRRRGYSILFHALTGGGLAAFYICIYFSFQVYHLTGQTVSFLISILVTALAVAMAVIHNAPVICLLGQLGGFLSPILISTGENRPITLFSFVTILNLATMGCAYFKNWRYVNALAFVGTWLLYVGWASKFYDESQLGIALFFSSLFYLIFLIVPTLRASAQGEVLSAENLWLVTVDMIAEFINNYILLYWDYRSWLGLAVILQALTLAAMYAYWARRSWEDSKTRATLLFATLALVTVAIPIQLRFYGIPIGWAMEAFVLGFIGQQYRHWMFQFSAMAVIALAAAGLLFRLPLHTQLFTPIFNRPFGSWVTVIALMFSLSALFQRYPDRLEESLKKGPALTLGLAVVLLCALIHMEISSFWVVQRGILNPSLAISHQHTFLIFLWSAIPLIFLWLGQKGIARFSIPAALIGYAVGVIVIFTGAVRGAWVVLDVPFLNLQWISRLVFVGSLWLGANWMRYVHDRPEKWEGWTATLHAVEGTGHVILVFLLYAEVNTWISASRVFSSFMRFGFVSTLWSLQALTLIGIGLRTRNQFRRILGFVLFGITVAKILIIDMAVLQPVYRILSFAATGVLLIVAAYLYQKFAKVLLESDPGHPEAARQATP